MKEATAPQAQPAAPPAVSFALYGPLPDADQPYCIRGWEPDAHLRMRMVFEAYAPTVEAAVTKLPDGYVGEEPTEADKREVPLLLRVYRLAEP